MSIFLLLLRPMKYQENPKYTEKFLVPSLSPIDINNNLRTGGNSECTSKAQKWEEVRVANMDAPD